MKKCTMMLSLLSAVTIFSCSKTETPNPEVGPEATSAYVSLTISAPAATRAEEGTEVTGSAAENQVDEVALLAFDKEYNYIANYTNGTLDKTGVNPVYECTVTADAARFLVVVNYSACKAIEDAMFSMSGSGTAANSLYKAFEVTEEQVAAMATAGKFVMINAGSFDSDTETNFPLVSLGDNEVLSQKEETPTKLQIPVDRILAKFNYAVKADLGLPTGAKGDVTGVKLNATNKSGFSYSEIMTTSLRNGADYRKDDNMRLDASSAGTALNWLLNEKDEERFYASSNTEYVLENTCDPSLHDYNNLTQAVVKARFVPEDVDVNLGVSWFSINIVGLGDVHLTFDDLVKYYKGTLGDEYGAPSDDAKINLDMQLNHLLSFSTDPAFASGGASWADDDVTIAVLDAIDYGGYRAATCEAGYFFKYYQHSINYYDIFIQHDDMVDIGHLGRWGMVRNNSYTMTINSIKAPGLPYIPSPFDEDIIDPKNPDPTKPEPADELDGFIDAEIVVNGWTIWTQENDLE